LLGVLSGCGSGSGSAEQHFSAQPRISLAGFDNSLFGQASYCPLIGQDALESLINKLPLQEHLRKISADTQWVNAA